MSGIVGALLRLFRRQTTPLIRLNLCPQPPFQPAATLVQEELCAAGQVALVFSRDQSAGFPLPLYVECLGKGAGINAEWGHVVTVDSRLTGAVFCEAVLARCHPAAPLPQGDPLTILVHSRPDRAPDIFAKLMADGVAIGIVAGEGVDRLRATLENIQAFTPMEHELWLLGDGPDRETAALLEAWPPDRQSTTAEAKGLAACLNRLARESRAGVLILLEAGSLVSPEWLERLLEGMAADPRNGLAGPSTNRSWNEQQVFRTAGDVVVRARQTHAWFTGMARTLEPLYSLADFCYLVRREVVESIGAADEAYGLGPCWEMDYNIRAARAGWRGVWVGSAYVERMPLAPRRQRHEAALFERNKRLYQSKFCGRQLAGSDFFRSHCRGDACPNFAPASGGRMAVCRIEGTERPAVTCLMPTCNRREWVARSIGTFLGQDFQDSELLVLDDGTDPVADLIPANRRIRYQRLDRRYNLGAKRNLGCSLSRGELIAHWDDDDWYPSWRLSRQVEQLRQSGDDICGSSRIYFLDRAAGHAYRYTYEGPLHPWVAGSTLMYRNSLWWRHPFPETQIGEDVRFLAELPDRRVSDLLDARLCVAAVHAGNTSRKLMSDAFWKRIPLEELEAVVREGAPLVSCIMPTYNRRAFLPLAIEAFEAQDYPHRELIIVDDGSEPVEDLAAHHPRILYHRLHGRRTVGEKRNIACALARGRIIAHWDDDDWYGPSRLSLQTAPLVAGDAGITGMDNTQVLSLEDGQFWRITAELHRRMFVGDVHGGTIVFWKHFLDEGIRYPEVNLAEDAGLIHQSLRRGHRLCQLSNEGAFVYIRHGKNTWRFQEGRFLDPSGWKQSASPETFPEALVNRYRAAAGVGCAAEPW